MPEGYERATGVKERLWQCQDCKKFFRVVNVHDTDCTHCKSTRTQVVESGTRQSTVTAT